MDPVSLALQVPDAQPWIGVDLDATLFHHDFGNHLSPIGEPIPAMVNQVKDWIQEGKKVKIFTARADHPEEAPKIQDSLNAVGLFGLEITSHKDQHMTALYDDKAHHVIPNTGKIVS